LTFTPSKVVLIDYALVTPYFQGTNRKVALSN
jgi:hypothetical protein